MANKKIFRIHRGTEGEGWFKSQRISPKMIQGIKSSDKSGVVATSIPTPFARIDLVKNAFDVLGRTKSIIGRTDNHKLVSDALDVAQLFFNFSKVKNKYPNAEIIVWEPTKDLRKAQENSRTKILGDTLDLFWKRDKDSYNFKLVDKLFILKINHRIVGGTSPSTMFFSSQDVGKYNFDFNFGNVRLFDADYESIAERDEQFIKYMYAVSKRENFPHVFKEVYAYLEEALDVIKQEKGDELWSELCSYSRDTFDKNFSVLKPEGLPEIQICGFPVGSDVVDSSRIEQNSDFIIQTSKTLKEGVSKPMVLPCDTCYDSRIYVNDVWDSNIVAPEKDPAPLSQRVLPGQADRYPYLTKGDFFEDTLIQLEAPVDQSAYHFFGFDEYLLPIKPLLFEYFTVEEVVSKGMINVDTSIPGGAVYVTLNIPVKKGNIEFSKLYHKEDKVYKEFYFALYPNIRPISNQTINLDYYLNIIDDSSHDVNASSLRLFCEGEEIKSSEQLSVKKRTSSSEDDHNSLSYKSSVRMDAIQVSLGGFKGMFLPNMKRLKVSNTKAVVAVDFGTTNTHIEYSFENSTARSYEVNGLLSSLFDYEKNKTTMGKFREHQKLLEMELFPYEIGSKSEVSYPMRTALLYNKGLDWSMDSSVGQDSNIGYFYEKCPVCKCHDVATDLKWNNLSDPVEYKKVEHFLEGLLLSIKNKLLVEGITVASNITLRWLYPVSMTNFQKNKLDSMWSDLSARVLGSSVVTEEVPESIAPFCYYNGQDGLVGLTASIDIGGGTSDITVFEAEKPLLVSSFGFAGNAVLGDGYNSSLQNNGFYRMYRTKFEEQCKKHGANDKIEIMEQIVNGSHPDSANFCSYLFSIEDSIFNFSQALEMDGLLKLPYLVFYSAQAYYLAHLMKHAGCEPPKNIIFSGAGSKSVSILDADRRTHQHISELFGFFFRKVYDLNEIENIKIKIADNPKEITCKGALYSNDREDLKPKIAYWFGGIEDGDKLYFANNRETSPTYDVWDTSMKNDVIGSIRNFFDIFDEYVNYFDVNDEYLIDVDALDVFKSIRNRNLIEYLEKGISKKQGAEGKKNGLLTEGAFFYPLVGILNELSKELADSVLEMA